MLPPPPPLRTLARRPHPAFAAQFRGAALGWKRLVRCGDAHCARRGTYPNASLGRRPRLARRAAWLRDARCGTRGASSARPHTAVRCHVRLSAGQRRPVTDNRYDAASRPLRSARPPPRGLWRWFAACARAWGACGASWGAAAARLPPRDLPDAHCRQLPLRPCRATAAPPSAATRCGPYSARSAAAGAQRARNPECSVGSPYGRRSHAPLPPSAHIYDCGKRLELAGLNPERAKECPRVRVRRI